MYQSCVRSVAQLHVECIMFESGDDGLLFFCTGLLRDEV